MYGNHMEDEEAKPSSELESDSARATMDSQQEGPGNESECFPESDESFPIGTARGSQDGGETVETQPPEPSPAGDEGDGCEDSIRGKRDSVDEPRESSHDGGDKEAEAPVQPSVVGEGDSFVNGAEMPSQELPVSAEDGGEDVIGATERQHVDGDVVTGEEKGEDVDGQYAVDGEVNRGAEEADTAERLEAKTKPPENASLAELSDDGEIPDDKELADVAGFTKITPQDKEAVETANESRAESEMEQIAEVEKEADEVERIEVDMMEKEDRPENMAVADFAEKNDASEDKASADDAEGKEAAEDTMFGEIAEERENVLEEKMVSHLADETGIQQETGMIDVEEAGEVAEEKGKGEEMQVNEDLGEAETRPKDKVETEEEDSELADVDEVPEEGLKEGERKVTEVAEEAEVRTDDEVEKDEDIEMADGTERMEIQRDSSLMALSENTETQDEAVMADVGEEEPEEAEEEEPEEESKSLGGKRKRGRNSKAVKGSGKKKVEEDVCFICFDGGELVLCDRRGCPKVYHPSCVGRDDAFFQSKGKWNCGWHLCSKCGKTAFYMCYTCTFSLCKGCIKDDVIFCLRGNKGLCETCIETVKLIENKEQGKKDAVELDFDDKSSWEYLFKDYWIDLKDRLSITSEELAQAKSPWKGHDSHASKLESTQVLNDADNGEGSNSDSTPKRRKTRRQSKSGSAIGKDSSTVENTEWASKELLDIVKHIRDGDGSFLPRSEVHNLLLEYIKRYNLRDPRRKSQVICDSRLQNLFGKSHVGHFEMLNLLDFHFLKNEDSQADDPRGGIADTEANYLDTDENSDLLTKTGKDKKRKMRKKGGNRGRQSNLDDFAAIDMHNINLVYLRRNLVEDLMEDSTTFHDKVVGAFVRIRISGNQKQDLYRLVQVVGTSEVAEPYKVGKKTTHFLFEILNLNKTEVISIDIISNQDFTEDECKRLRQSIRCGLISRLTVGDIQEKAIMLQEVRIKNWLEAETVRLTHLRDRASDMGHRKELRECVEKLQLLKSPDERQRRLEEIPEIHADPSMDPKCESEDEETEEKERDNHLRPRGSSLNRRGREQVSPRRGGFGSSDSWSGIRNYSSMSRELSRNLSGRGLSSRADTPIGSDERVHENLSGSGKEREGQQSNNYEKPMSVSVSDNSPRSSRPVATPELLSSKAVPEISSAPPSTTVSQTASNINESEKIWHYKDPSEKVQGPFSIVQLRKWSSKGFFPADLIIWKTDKQEDSILLTDALAGNFHKQTSSAQTVMYSGKAPASIEIPKQAQDSWSSATNLPSPTPKLSTTPTPTKRRAFESRWSPFPVQPSVQLANTSIPQSGLSPASKPDVSMLPNPAGAPQMEPEKMLPSQSQRSQVNPHFPTPIPSNVSVNHPGSAMNVPSPTPTSGTQGWGNAPSQNPSPSFNAGNPSGTFPAQNQSNFPQSDPRRLPVPNQFNVQVPTPPNTHLGDNMFNNQNTAQMQAQTNQNNGWGPVPVNPHMGWGGMVKAGTNMNWGASVPGGKPNPGWVGPPQGQAQGYSNSGWGMPSQVQAPGNAASGWAVNGNNNQAPPNQGSVPGNPNPIGLNQQAFWGNQPNQNGEGFPNQRNGDSSGYGGANAWNRQSSFGSGGSSGSSFKGQRVCKFYRENGYCKKGASCDYLHS